MISMIEWLSFLCGAVFGMLLVVTVLDDGDL